MKLAIALSLLAAAPTLANAHTEGIQCRLNLAGKEYVIKNMPGTRSLEYESVLTFKQEQVNVSISIAESGRYMIYFYVKDVLKGNKQLLLSQGNSDLFSGGPDAYIFAAADHGTNEKARIAVGCE